jgi:hypothetical protein
MRDSEQTAQFGTGTVRAHRLGVVRGTRTVELKQRSRAADGFENIFTSAPAVEQSALASVFFPAFAEPVPSHLQHARRRDVWPAKAFSRGRTGLAVHATQATL